MMRGSVCASDHTRSVRIGASTLVHEADDSKTTPWQWYCVLRTYSLAQRVVNFIHFLTQLVGNPGCDAYLD